MGDAYLLGEGVLEDPVEAWAWYKIAADRGNKDAAASLLSLSKELTTKQKKLGERRATEIFEQIDANKAE